MAPIRKLAVRIALLTAAGLVVAAALLALEVYRKAPRASAPEMVLQLGHGGRVSGVAFSPDGQILASASSDNTVKLWDPPTGALLRTLAGDSGDVLSVAFSPDGQTLASGSDDNTVKLWNPATGALLRTLSGHQNSVLSVAFSPDGQALASASDDNTVKLWNPATGALLRTLTGHQKSVWSVVFSPDGQTLASASWDSTVKLWNSGTGALLRTLAGHQTYVQSVAFSPDGRTLASASWDKTIKLWNPATGALLRTLTGHQDSVLSVAFSTDGQTLASASWDKTVKLWNSGTGALLRTLAGHQNSVLSLAFSPDGHTLASASWDTTVKLWNRATGALLRTLAGYQNTVNSVVFSPDGQTLASASPDKTVKLWNSGTGALLRTLARHQDTVHSVAFSPDGHTLVSASDDNAVNLWNAASGDFLRTLAGHQNTVYSVAFSPDGHTLASAGLDGTVELWNSSTGTLLRTLAGPQSIVYSVAFSPDGHTLASASADQTVLWNSGTGALLRTLAGHQGSVNSVAFSPDGRTLASATYDGTVKLWNSGTGTLLRTLAGHQNKVRSVAFSPDGRTLASASSDNTVQLWNSSTGALLRTLAGHQNDVYSVAFSPDGQTLASGSADGSIILWRVSNGALESATFILPGTEWMTYVPSNLYYTSSQQASNYAAIRFDSELRGLYPLSRPLYGKLRVPDARRHLNDPPPDLKPDLLYNAQTSLESHRTLLSAFGLLYVFGVAFTLVLHRRSDPSAIARRFFTGAGLKISAPHAELLQVANTGNTPASFAFLWDAKWRARAETVRQHRSGDERRFKLYLVYRGQPPSSEEWASLRDTLNCDVIPLESNVLERAISDNSCAERLRDIEEPFVVLTDPYDRTTALTDATLFFGRADVIEEIPKALRQGQHTAILGLRRIGKTSVIKQVENRLLSVPFASFEIISHETADRHFTRILEELWSKMRTMRLKGVLPVTTVRSDSEFRDQFLSLYACWEATGSREPFVLMLDEAERLFPPRDEPANEPDLTETGRFFRVLRALAQERRCLVVFAAAYRPNLNRWNRLGERAGENALFQQYREIFLAPLDSGSTEAMLTKLGLLRGIQWTPDALSAAYDYSGGHPQLARFFASDVSRQGKLLSIDAARVNETAEEIRRDFRKHRISTLLRESIWMELRADEQRVLTALIQGVEPKAGDLEALTDLELLGVVRKNGDGYRVGARLLLDWLKENVD